MYVKIISLHEVENPQGEMVISSEVSVQSPMWHSPICWDIKSHVLGWFPSRGHRPPCCVWQTCGCIALSSSGYQSKRNNADLNPYPLVILPLMTIFCSTFLWFIIPPPHICFSSKNICYIFG